VYSTLDEKTRLPKPIPVTSALRDRTAIALSNHTLLVRSDGTTVPIDDSAAPVVDEDGKVLGAVLVFRDATERQQLQSNLLVADRMVSMGMLAAGVAHEVNNPLASVMANVEFADRDVAELERRLGASTGLTEIREALHDAREGSDRIRQIVRDLKVFSRSEEERRTLVDVRQVIESTLRLAWNEVRHRARLVKNYGKTPPVEASEARLGQAFLNLLINAAQAIPEGRADSNEIRITTSTDASGSALIEIEDTGEGMTPEVLGRLFQPFFTTKPVGTGTGLGLSLCRRILTDVGGTISIRSTLGSGTVVSVVVPPKTTGIVASRGSIRTDSASYSMKPPRRGRVLVVDDEPAVAKVLTRALTSDHDVVALVHAEEALQRIVAGERFDVIFCDLMMPQMTGMDFFEALARDCPEQASKMVFVTGGAFTPRGRQFLDDVPNQRIEKPFDFRQILALVNERVR
jgi:signal transduction histidine kinase/CheY-like chemotaxis protein